MCRIDPNWRETGLKYRVTDYLPVSRDKIQREMNRTVTDTIVNPKNEFCYKGCVEDGSRIYYFDDDSLMRITKVH